MDNFYQAVLPDNFIQSVSVIKLLATLIEKYVRINQIKHSNIHILATSWQIQVNSRQTHVNFSNPSSRLMVGSHLRTFLESDRSANVFLGSI